MALRNHAIDQLELTQPNADFCERAGSVWKTHCVLVDFGVPDTTSPPCGQQDRVRRRRPPLEPIESEERARAQEELQRLADPANVVSQSEVAQTSA